MLDQLIDARRAELSPGFEVRRILPYRLRRMLGPFIFMDHAGPVNLPPERLPTLDVLPHPHIGLSTVSYLFGGQVTHRDSLGVEQVIRPGEVNWMTAGRGIAHSERFEDPAALVGGLEMVQTWVALPAAAEEQAPTFCNYQPAELPVFEPAPGVWGRLIAGAAYGLRNAVSTHSPLFYVHLTLAPGARFELPRGHAERGAYVVRGAVEVGATRYPVGQLLVFTAAPADPVLTGGPDGATLLLLGGEPLGERFIWWNFVSSRRERIEQAKADWLAGRIALPPTDNAAFVPLPPDRGRPASTEQRSAGSGGPAPEVLS